MTSPENYKSLKCDTTEEYICSVVELEKKQVNAEDSEKKVKEPTGNKSKTPSPSRMTSGKYAVLMETNGKECESWLYFIRQEGNEKSLQYLQNQLEKVDWYIMDDLSTFDLDLEHFVSANTAKEMTKTELNSYSFHRKFDGVLDKINFGFKKRDDDENKMCKVFDHIGYGQIEDFINDEDLDEEDLTDSYDTDDESETDYGSCSESDILQSETDELIKKSTKKREPGIPPGLLNSNLPMWARVKKAKKHIPLEKRVQ
jgi:hypothetical protein